MKLTANVRTVMVKQFINGATIAELARSWPFQPIAIEAVLRKRLKFHEMGDGALGNRDHGGVLISFEDGKEVAK